MGMTASYDLQSPRDDDTSIAVIHQALDLGMTLIDTADAYGPFTNEELVGRALAGGYRERAVLATKVGLVMGDIGANPARGTASPGAGRNGRPEHVRELIDGSLRRLGAEYVDLYQLHRVDPNVPLEETWGAMAETVAAGKARHIGLSEVSVAEIKQAQAVHPVTSVQSELSLWTRDVLAEVLPYCKEQGIALIPFSPLGRGFLVGRFSSFDDLPEDDFRRQLPRFQVDALRANLAIVGGVREVAERTGASPGPGGAGVGAGSGTAGGADPRDQDAEVPGGQRRRGHRRAGRGGPRRARRAPGTRGNPLLTSAGDALRGRRIPWNPQGHPCR